MHSVSSLALRIQRRQQRRRQHTEQSGAQYTTVRGGGGGGVIVANEDEDVAWPTVKSNHSPAWQLARLDAFAAAAAAARLADHRRPLTVSASLVCASRVGFARAGIDETEALKGEGGGGGEYIIHLLRLHRVLLCSDGWRAQRAQRRTRADSRMIAADAAATEWIGFHWQW